MPEINRLKKRRQFLAAAKGHRVARPGVVIQAIHRDDDLEHIGVGFTATKKIGGAVTRNRAKRRLRELSRHYLPKLGAPGHDYVFIARAKTAESDWTALSKDVESALKKIRTFLDN